MGNAAVATSSLGSIDRYGGPIVYLIAYVLTLTIVLVLMDPGFRALSCLKSRRRTSSDKKLKRYLAQEESDITVDSPVASSNLLRISDLSKTFHGHRVVDGLNLEIP